MQNDVIDERLLEVSVNIKSWGGVKRDPSKERAIREASGATRQVGHFDTYLVSKDTLAEIKTIDGAWRNRHTALTLPWSDTTRVVTVAGLKLWSSEMRRFAELRNDAVDRFCTNWPALVEQAKVELNGEFNADNYPSVAEVRARFVAETDYFAVRRGKHLGSSQLVNVIGDMVDSRAQEIEDRAKERLSDAVTELVTRIKDKVSHFSERMRAYEEVPNPEFGNKKRAQPTVVKGKFKTNTIDNLRDLVEVLPGLNIYDDPTITEVLADIGNELTGAGTAEQYTQELREDDALRAAVADKADAILDKLAAF